MKVKKLLYTLVLSTILIVSSLVMSATSYAATTTTFGLEEYRKALTDSKQYGYQVLSQKIWKIVKYNNGGSAIDYDTAIYCLRAGYGFYTETPGTFKEDYNASYNFKDKNAINMHTDLNNNYKNVLWILDNAYIPTSSTALNDRKALLQAAGIPEDSELTDDDIDTIQQLAIWYYTNTSEETYHKIFAGEPVLNTVFQSIKTTGGASQYLAIDDVNTYRYADMEILYKYLVTEAGKSENLTQYDQNLAVPPVSLAKTNPTAQYMESTLNYIVGPYKIEKNNTISYQLTAKFTDQNNNTLTGCQLLDSNKQPTSKTIGELIGQEFYISVPATMADTVREIKFTMDGTYKTTNMTYWTINGNNQVQPLVVVDKKPNNIFEGNTIEIQKIKQKEFDLSLRKFITKVNNQTVNREPTVDVTPLVNKTSTTAIYNHTKSPVAVKKGDIVTYTIRVYNEGEKDGYVGEITDYLPAELEFINDLTNYPEETKFNGNNGWIINPQNPRIITTSKLAYSKNAADASKNTANKLEAFNGTTLDYLDVEVKCKIKTTASSSRKITNLAQITVATDIEGKEIKDRDSTPNGNFVLPSDVDLPTYKDTEINRGDKYIPGQEDDDDFEKLKVQEFDLSLRKFITSVNDIKILGREPEVDITPLLNGTSTTAIYNHTKKPLNVQIGDTVTYTIRVYNEAEIDGYANKIIDHLPAELEFLPDDPINQKYGWILSEDGRKIETTYLSIEEETTTRINLIAAFNNQVLDYRDVEIKCKVKDTAPFGKKLTNLAEIAEYADNMGADILDRDSKKDNMNIPADEDLPYYKDNEINSGDKYIPGQEDDDDFEKVRIVYFDLALRKFITGVNDTEVTNRIPQVSMGEEGNLKYEHTKEPVEVENGNVITYTLRVFNEGLMNGYASEVVDDVPEGLIFLSEDQTNIDYRWVMYKELVEKEEVNPDEQETEETEEQEAEENEEVEIFEYGNKKYVRTDKPEEANLIKTDYLAKEQERESGKNLIKAFEPEEQINQTNPDYRDILVKFLVTEPNTSDRIIINTAEISDDRDETNEPVEDVDSTPKNENEWNLEDDLDKEFIKVKYFDLALKKWVSKVIIIENGEQTVTDTGHTGEENPEPVVKVDLHRKKLDKVTVKFEFQIKITNEGEIAGYAKEVTDYIPEGLKFIPEDNPIWYKREPLNGKERVATKALENTLLQPGESASVGIVLTWINNEDNMGLKVNIAEISKDYNDSLTPDIDSTPDNFIEGEDDQDDAPVMVAIELGQTRIYFGLIFMVLGTIAVGVLLIKKFVLY